MRFCSAVAVAIAVFAAAAAANEPRNQSLRRSSSSISMSRGEGGGGVEPGPRRFAQGVKTALTSAAIGLALVGPMLSLPTPASASGKRAVGEISASGLVFKVSYLLYEI